jgi:hypothetical protein
LATLKAILKALRDTLQETSGSHGSAFRVREKVVAPADMRHGDVCIAPEGFRRIEAIGTSTRYTLRVLVAQRSKVSPTSASATAWDAVCDDAEAVYLAVKNGARFQPGDAGNPGVEQLIRTDMTFWYAPNGQNGDPDGSVTAVEVTYVGA